MTDLTMTPPNRLERLSEVPAFEVKAVMVTDEAGVNPVECEFVWAWISSGPRK